MPKTKKDWEQSSLECVGGEGEIRNLVLAMLNLRDLFVVQLDEKEFGDQGNGQDWVYKFGNQQCRYRWVDSGDWTR